MSVFQLNVCRPGTGFVKPATTVVGKVPHLARLLLEDEKGYFYFKAIFNLFLLFFDAGRIVNCCLYDCF